MAHNKSFGSFTDVDNSLKSIITNDMWDISLADFGIENFVAEVSGLPNPTVSTHAVDLKGKTLYFSKMTSTNGEITVTFRQDNASTVRMLLENGLVKNTRDGTVQSYRLSPGNPVINVYKDVNTVARTYKLFGATLDNVSDGLTNLTGANGGGSTADITLTIKFTDYELQSF